MERLSDNALKEVTKRLIGPIYPQGDSNLDKERLENLNSQCTLVTELLDEIMYISTAYNNSHESSVKVINMKARNFLVDLLEGLQDDSDAFNIEKNKMDLSTSSEIKRIALFNHRHPETSYSKLLELSAYFDDLNDEELQKEKEIIELEVCKYDSESVFKYHVALRLYNVILKKRKEMSEFNLKEIVKDNTVSFKQYRANVLYYNVVVKEETYMFPVPTEDIGDATFNATDKAMMFMRYIRKAIEDKTFVKDV
jgi:hypothetical protein